MSLFEGLTAPQRRRLNTFIMDKDAFLDAHERDRYTYWREQLQHAEKLQFTAQGRYNRHRAKARRLRKLKRRAKKESERQGWSWSILPYDLLRIVRKEHRRAIRARRGKLLTCHGPHGGLYRATLLGRERKDSFAARAHMLRVRVEGLVAMRSELTDSWSRHPIHEPGAVLVVHPAQIHLHLDHMDIIDPIEAIERKIEHYKYRLKRYGESPARPGGLQGALDWLADEKQRQLDRKQTEKIDV